MQSNFLSYLPYALAVVSCVWRAALRPTGANVSKAGFPFMFLVDRRLLLIGGAIAAVNFYGPAVTERGQAITHLCPTGFQNRSCITGSLLLSSTCALLPTSALFP